MTGPGPGVVGEQGFSRLDRVRSTVQRVLAGPIADLARERGAGLATITAVEVSPDLRHARVALSVYGVDDAERTALVRELNAGAGDCQRLLARQLRTRRTPVLAFQLDDVLERSDRIQRLLDDGRD